MFGAKPVPSIKLATNTPMYNRLRDDMDINCGGIIDGTKSMQEMGREIFDELLRTVSATKPKAKSLDSVIMNSCRGTSA
jgi:altronate hydrolase